MKNVFILGDSYSTYDGYIPMGYLPYYGPYLDKANPLCTMTVEDCWWYKGIKQYGWNIVRNDSWSGSTIGYRGYDGNDYKYCSFITRLKKLIEEDFFNKNKIDSFILFGATNDSWCDAPLGDKDSTDYSEENLYNVLPAINYLFTLIKENIKNINIYVIVNTELKDDVKNQLINKTKENEFNLVVLNDISKEWGHPTPLGMNQILEQLMNVVNK